MNFSIPSRPSRSKSSPAPSSSRALRAFRALVTGAACTAVALAIAGTTACSVKTEEKAAPAATKTDGGTSSSTKVKPKKQAKSSKLATLAKGTPEGATSQGKKTRPSAGGSVVPIVDVEVFVVLVDIDDDGADDTINWAQSEDGTTFLWAEGPVTCADGLSDGTGGFLASIAADGTGAYLFALDACPEQNLFGCSFDADGVETSCGACAWSDEAIVCVEAS